jgi:hypothetical protein
MPNLNSYSLRGSSGQDAGPDARIIRQRQAAMEATSDCAKPQPAFRSARQLVQVYNAGSMPTTPDHFFACHPATLDGAEQEGGTSTPLVDNTVTLFVDFLHAVPSAGDFAVATAVGSGRWVSDRKSGTTSICLTVCSGVPVYSATIQLWTTGSNSSLVASCTTTTSGCCSFTQTGSYIVKVYVSGTLEYSATRTLNRATISIALSSGSNVVCCGGYAIPTTLTLTDAAGSLSFVYYPNYYSPIWYGGHSVSRLSCSVTTPNNVCVAAAPSQGPVKACYQMICNAGSQPTFSIQRAWSWVYQQGTLTPIWYQDPSGITPGQPCTTAPPASCGSPHTDTASFSANPSSTSPFALSGTPAAAAGNYTSDPVGGTVAISA